MPEGPEARCVADDLHLCVSGKTITSVKLYPTARGKNLDQLREGLYVQKVYSRGKKVIFMFDHDQSLVASLAMEGKFRYEEPDSHVHFCLTFASEEGRESLNVYYADHRFGSNRFCENKEALEDALKNVGPDLLQDDISFDQYCASIDKHKRAVVGNWIYEQKYFSGVGNYLRSDILYLAKLHPHRKLSTLSLDERERLYTTVRNTIQKAYEGGGLTIRSYATPNGKTGLYKPAIYGRDMNDEGIPVTKMKASNGQSIYYVESIQSFNFSK